MNSRALLFSLLIAAVGAALMLLYQRRYEAEIAGGDKVVVLVPNVPLERGKPIDDKALTTREIPQAYAEGRAIRASERAKIVGLRVGNKVEPNETLMWTDLTTTGEDHRSLSELIQPGSRAVSIRANRDDSNVALIHPGDYVDIISVQNSNEKGGNPSDKQAIVILQRVLVVATGNETTPDGVTDPKAGRNADRDSLLTLSLSLPEAQILEVARGQGRVNVALRPADDQRTQESQVVSASALFDQKRLNTVRQAPQPSGPIQVGGGK